MIIEKRKDNESNESLIRRFTRRVQSSGILQQKKRTQFYKKEQNRRQRRERAVARERFNAQVEYLMKIGRLEDRPGRSSRRW